ncbi:transcriptional regulator [Sphaerisporangium rufum]|uniref:Transcriptional regulator n=1 Tax=Sphaerisporangium rufum TaxID=1381558 RepID=A0A919RDB8_9ACTN|nr:helix-turn-helix transcriptional regulator [Sphaerisporangium rufum]GII81982.1 transcriptional regulator [Sphaerisporangium rufum]
MKASGHSPTVRRRRLSKALLAFRRQADLRAEEVARRLGWQASKVTRIERNEWKLPSVGDVLDLLDLYDVTDKTVRDAMIALARQARQRGWWEEYRDVLGGALPEFEIEARTIRTFETLLVPGLLQTAAYAGAVFRGGQAIDDELVERRVEARLTRQRIFDSDHPPTLWAVIDEAALLKHAGGPHTMRAQLEHIIEMARRPKIGVQVLPNAVGAHASMSGPFSILEFTEADPTLVYVETTTGDLFVEGDEAVSRYTLRYDHLRASALSAEASEKYLIDLVGQLK